MCRSEPTRAENLNPGSLDGPHEHRPSVSLALTRYRQPKAGAVRTLRNDYSFIVGSRCESLEPSEAQVRRGKGFVSKSLSLAVAIASDIHFWVPVVVLVAGLAVLRWIS